MQTSRQAFTRTELFVVVTIIVILSLLITGAPHTGTPNVRQVEIMVELQQMGSAIEEYKLVYGAYPPNLMKNSVPEHLELDASTPKYDVLAEFKRAFPRCREPDSLLLALSGEQNDTSSTTVLPGGVLESEAVFLWLGGFSPDPEYPLTNVGGPSFSDAEGNNNGILDSKDENIEARNSRFYFEFRRLGPKTREGKFDDRGSSNRGGRYIEYDDPRNGTRRRINLWQYFPRDSKMPFVYFDVSRFLPSEYYPAKNPFISDNVGPITRLHENANRKSIGLGDFLFVEQGKFQILHAGLDDSWGDFSGIRSGLIVFPEGPFTGELADTLANFSISTLADSAD